MLHEKWVALHEGHGQNKLSAVNPFLGSIPTSSLHGESEDREVYAWEHRCSPNAETFSFTHFRTRMELTRYRMQRLLAAVEPTPLSENLYFLLPTLRTTQAEFRSLLQAPCAWQDIHAADTELISRAEAVLRRMHVL